jgi:putative sigma-54 modulation protein
MKIHLTPRHLKLTSAIETHAVNELNALGEIDQRIISAHAVLSRDDTVDPALRFTVSAHLAVAGPDLHAEESSADLYAAFDAVKSKLARQLRKRKTRLTDKRRSDIQRESERQLSTPE